MKINGDNPISNDYQREIIPSPVKQRYTVQITSKNKQDWCGVYVQIWIGRQPNKIFSFTKKVSLLLFMKDAAPTKIKS